MSDEKTPSEKYAEIYDKLKATCKPYSGTNAPPPAPKIPSSYIPASLNSERSYPAAIRKPKATATLTALYQPIKADANHWSLEVDWDIHDGAILVLDLEPREGLGGRFAQLLRPDMSDSMATGSLTSEQLATYRHVQTIVRRATGENSTLPKKYNRVREDISGYRDTWIATPADFAAWAVKFSPVPVPEWMTALIPGHKPAVPAGQSEDLEPRERETLLKLFLYFARKYRYDSNAERSPATGMMREELLRQGIKIDDKTIRKWMKLAAE